MTTLPDTTTAVTSIPLAEHWVQRRQILSQWKLVIEHFDAVTVIESLEHNGVNIHSGKPYRRFERKYVTYSMRPTRTGKRLLRVFTKTTGRTGVAPNVRDETAHVALVGTHYTEIRSAIERMISRVTGEPPCINWESEGLLRYIYPVLADLVANNKDYFSGAPIPGAGGAFRLGTVQDLTRALFGKRRYRKDLVRAVATSPLGATRVAYELRNLVEVDWIVELLRKSSGSRQWTYSVPTAGLVAVFSAIPKHRRRALLLSMHDRTFTGGMRDAVRMATTVVNGGHFTTEIVSGCRTWEEIHDTLIPAAIATESLRHETAADPSIKLRPITEALNGTQTGAVTFEAARSLDDLMLWGRELRNCIGSYFRPARSGTSNLFVLMQDGKMLANMEVTARGEISQLYGFANSPLDCALDRQIRDHVAATLAPVLKKALTLVA